MCGSMNRVCNILCEAVRIEFGSSKIVCSLLGFMEVNFSLKLSFRDPGFTDIIRRHLKVMVACFMLRSIEMRLKMCSLHKVNLLEFTRTY